MAYLLKNSALTFCGVDCLPYSFRLCHFCRSFRPVRFFRFFHFFRICRIFRCDDDPVIHFSIYFAIPVHVPILIPRNALLQPSETIKLEIVLRVFNHGHHHMYGKFITSSATQGGARTQDIPRGRHYHISSVCTWKQRSVGQSRSHLIICGLLSTLFF